MARREHYFASWRQGDRGQSASADGDPLVPASLKRRAIQLLVLRFVIVVRHAYRGSSSSFSARRETPYSDALMVVMPPHHGQADPIGSVDDYFIGHALPLPHCAPTNPIVALANVLLDVGAIGLVATMLARHG